jgi:superoxide dismutase
MFALPKLPYPYDALAPVISDRTLRLHHDKHHATYVKTTNELLEKSGKSAASLEEVITGSAKASERRLFNNAAQAWNHAFFWEAMSPERTTPTDPLKAAIDKAFGGWAGLKTAFVTGGVDQFGSGWVWLVSDGEGALRVLHRPGQADRLTGLRRLGTRLLSRPPERPEGLSRVLVRRPAQLAFRLQPVRGGDRPGLGLALYRAGSGSGAGGLGLDLSLADGGRFAPPLNAPRRGR